MMKLTTLTATVALAVGFTFGLAGTAQAVHPLSLENGDAETGDLTGWNADGAMGAVGTNDSGNITVDTAGDSNFFSTGEAGVAEGASAGMDQDVDVWGCGVEYAEGDWTFDALYATGTASGGDTGDIAIEFFDKNGNPIPGVTSFGNLETAVAGDWDSVSQGTTQVPEGAATMNVMVQGTDDDEDAVADVGFDNLAVALTDCLKNFVKISGKAMDSTKIKNGGRNGKYSFEGSIGQFHDGAMEITGEIAVNYKDLGLVCVFTTDDEIEFGVDLPGLPTDGDLDAFLFEADYECNDGDPAVEPDFTGTADISLDPADDTTDNSGKNKDRGHILIENATDPQFDIALVALRNGNIHTDDDTSDGP